MKNLLDHYRFLSVTFFKLEGSEAVDDGVSHIREIRCTGRIDAAPCASAGAKRWMKTAFTPTQLANPELAEAAGIIQSCEHYGFCTATCPTYVVLGNENDSPRGRIDLIRAMLEDGGTPDAQTVGHIDRCLSCLSCMTTCAAKVDYMHLVDRARVHIETKYRRPVLDRLVRAIIAAIVPRPGRFRRAIRLARVARAVSFPLPQFLRPLIDLAPAGVPRDGPVAPGIYPAEGIRRMRVGLLAGCAQSVLRPSIDRAAVRLLTRHGCDIVVTAGARCCGALTLHMGREDEAKADARRVIRAWTREIEGEGLDAIVVTASGCGTTVKDYGHLFARDADLADAAQQISARALDISEIIARLGLIDPPAPQAHRIAYHDACSLQHGQRVTDEPRAALRRAGFTVHDVPEKHFCCGSAGTYNMLQPDLAAVFGGRKAANIEATGAELIAAGNLGCMVQIARYTALPIAHTAELLDWATGGPVPEALVNLPPPAPATGISKASAAPEADAFW